jgi:hypothetical protein
MIGVIVQALFEFLCKILLYFFIDILINVILLGTGECALYFFSFGKYEPFRKEILYSTQWKSVICGICIWVGIFMLVYILWD